MDRAALVEKVYAVIAERDGKLTTKEIVAKIGRYESVRYAVVRLTAMGRIKRVKTFRPDKEFVTFCYRTTNF